MSVPNQTPYIIYNANGLTTVFPFEFYIINAGDIQVSINGTTVTSGYSVSGTGNIGGGDVTFITPPASGSVVMLERVVPTYRLTDYQDNGDLLADTVNKDFDRLWMAIQRSFIHLGLALRRPLLGGPFNAEGYRIANLTDPVNAQDVATKNYVDNVSLVRALRVPESYVGILPTADIRANKLLGFNSAGQPVVVLPPDGSASDVLLQLASYDPPGTDLIGTVGCVNLTQYLARTFVFLDDIVPATDGSLDCSAAINSAISLYSGTGVSLMGNSSSTYRIDSTISFIGKNNITLNFNGAKLKDNVQGYISESGGRANHTFVIYDAENVSVSGFNYIQSATRANSYMSNGISACLFWVGGQYLGMEMTRHVYLHDITAIENSIYFGFVIANMGECDGLVVKRFNFKGGDWAYGFNAEYGRQPEDPSSNPSLTNGKHPYNILVEEFNADSLFKMLGWWRVASCYNIMFLNCTAYNTPSAVVYYSGDRGITRYGQNVIFQNCKAKMNVDDYPVANNHVRIAVVNKDGTTGEDLPSWTSYDYTVIFDNCEFWNVNALGSSCIRFMGNKGKTLFRACIFRNSYRGIHAEPSSNPTYDSKNGLTFENCIFKNNFQDAYLKTVTGSTFNHCTFKRGESTTLNPVEIDTNCQSTTIRDCLFDEILVGGLQYIKNSSPDVTLDNNTFYMKSVSDFAVKSLNRIYGSRNKSYGSTASGIAPITSTAVTDYRVIGEPTFPKLLSDAGSSTVNFEVCDFWNCSTASLSLSRIIGGREGDVVEFRGTTSTASVAFTNAGSGIAITERLLNKSSNNDTVSGAGWSRRYRKMSNGWWEV